MLDKFVEILERRRPTHEMHKTNKFEKFMYKSLNKIGIHKSIYTTVRACDFCKTKLTDETIIDVVEERNQNNPFIKVEELHECKTCKQRWEYDNIKRI